MATEGEAAAAVNLVVGAEEKDKTEVKKTEHGSTVAAHYNVLPETGLDKRVQSRIFYMRNFNNWIKSMVIGETLERIRKARGSEAELTVLDLCGGKGGDLQKWKKGRISRLVLADIAGTSVEQAEERYKENVERNARERHPSKLYSAEFITADCSKKRLKDLYKSPAPQFDIVSCQFSFHYSLESFEQTEMMLRNACECLKPGGYFIGTTPNSYELIKRLRAAEDMSFGNEVYRVTFQTDGKDNIPLFGAKYDFHLEGVVDCPEFLVYFPLLEKLAEKFGMKLIHRTPFAEYFEQHLKTHEGRGLLGRMQALEPYPAASDVELMSKDEAAYTAAHEAVDRLKVEQAQPDRQDQRRDHHHRGPRPVSVGTLSQAEWEATTVYLAFAFQKVGESKDDAEARTSSSTPTERTPSPSDDVVSRDGKEAEKRPLSEAEGSEEPAAKAAKT